MDTDIVHELATTSDVLTTASNFSNEIIRNGTFATPEMFRGFSDSVMIVLWIAFGTIWCFSFSANVMTLVLLFRIKTSPLNIFIMGLCFSDALSAITSPFTVKAELTFDGIYPWNRIICKTMLPLLSVASVVTIQLVLVLSIWRFCAIHKPQKTAGVMTIKRATVITISCWLITALLYIPFEAYTLGVYVSGRSGKELCYFRPQYFRIIRYFILIVDMAVCNLLPILIIVVVCIAIGISMIKQTIRRQTVSSNEGFRKAEKNALIQVTLIMLSFLIGYIPKFFYILLHAFFRVTASQRTLSFLLWRMTQNLTEAINPLLYNIGSIAIRNEVKKVLARACPTCKSTPSQVGATVAQDSQAATARTDGMTNTNEND